MYLHIQEGLRCYTKDMCVCYIFILYNTVLKSFGTKYMRRFYMEYKYNRGSKKYLFRMNIQVCKGRKTVQKRIKNQMIVLDFQQCLKKSFLILERTAIPVYLKCESTKQHCYRNVNSITFHKTGVKC